MIIHVMKDKYASFFPRRIGFGVVVCKNIKNVCRKFIDIYLSQYLGDL